MYVQAIDYENRFFVYTHMQNFTYFTPKNLALLVKSWMVSATEDLVVLLNSEATLIIFYVVLTRSLFMYLAISYIDKQLEIQSYNDTAGNSDFVRGGFTVTNIDGEVSKAAGAWLQPKLTSFFVTKMNSDALREEYRCECRICCTYTDFPVLKKYTSNTKQL